MSYEKIWKDNEKLNATEVMKLNKDGLQVLNDIPYYAANGFSSIPKEQWDLFKWAGLYLQRPKEAGYFMMRVKIPAGYLTNEQIKVLAEIGRDYGRDVIDITTRQAIQFHWLTIEILPDILDRLEKVGMSAVGACGDIPRNIVGNPLAGIDRDELVDTSDIVKEIDDYFDRNADFSNLPRKYKIGISSNVYNASNAEINCLAFVPASKVIDGEKVVGFHVKVGGGLSARPFLAQTLDLFVTPERVQEVTIAVTTIFRDFGYREKRHLSRLKFLVADWGPEKFTGKVREYVADLPIAGTDETKGWNAGYFYGAHPQKQEGLNYVGFNVPVGRLDSKELLELARIAEVYGNGEIRTCNSQNLLIPNIPDVNVANVLTQPIFDRIRERPNGFIGYSVSCTGIEYCNLALTETKERMRRIAEFLDENIVVDVPVRFHMIGCPNSCGQRQIADIGLQGIKQKTKDRGMVEAFEMYVGGTLLDGGEFNRKLKGKIEATYLGDVLLQFVTYFKESKLPSETFYAFTKRVGLEELQKELDNILENTIESVS